MTHPFSDARAAFAALVLCFLLLQTCIWRLRDIDALGTGQGAVHLA